MKNAIDFKWGYLIFGIWVMVSPLFGSCQKEEINQSVEFKPIEYLNECSLNIVDPENADSYLVINSQEELTQHILINEKEENACVKLSEELNIDFSKWTILIGKKRLTHIEGELITQNVVKRNNELIYKVRIKNGGYTAIGQFRFGVLIPKISTGANVTFDIQVE